MPMHSTSEICNGRQTPRSPDPLIYCAEMYISEKIYSQVNNTGIQLQTVLLVYDKEHQHA